MPTDRCCKAYIDAVERISADMGRLVGIIEVMLTGDESAYIFLHFNEIHFANAAWKVGGMFFGIERDIYNFQERWLPLDPERPAVSDPATDGVELFGFVMSQACNRWGIPLSWVRDEDDGRLWVGHAFPDDFPDRASHAFLPDEVKRLRLAHRLTTIPTKGADEPPHRLVKPVPPPEMLRDGRIIPIRLGASHKEIVLVWTGVDWQSGNLKTPSEFKVLRAVIGATTDDRDGLDKKDLIKHSGVNTAPNVFNGLKTREPFKVILPPKANRGRGSGRDYRLQQPTH